MAGKLRSSLRPELRGDALGSRAVNPRANRSAFNAMMADIMSQPVGPGAGYPGENPYMNMQPNVNPYTQVVGSPLALEGTMPVDAQMPGQASLQNQPKVVKQKPVAGGQQRAGIRVSVKQPKGNYGKGGYNGSYQERNDLLALREQAMKPGFGSRKPVTPNETIGLF